MGVSADESTVLEAWPCTSFEITGLIIDDIAARPFPAGPARGRLCVQAGLVDVVSCAPVYLRAGRDGVSTLDAFAPFPV